SPPGHQQHPSPAEGRPGGVMDAPEAKLSPAEIRAARPPAATKVSVEKAPTRAKAKRPGSKAAARRAIERRTGGTRVSVTQANPLALSRQEMGLLTKRLLVLALSDITR